MCQGDVLLIAERSHGPNGRTCIFRKYIPVPRDGRVNKGPGSTLVDVDGKIDGYFGPTPPPDVRSQSPRTAGCKPGRADRW